ncbi:MAG: hypothetical protein O7G85_02655 [Planctomycetota bacterium]|nr:hypothetical protein [Planctomycetota bacterium]
MWPFSKPNQDNPLPTIKVGDLIIKWDKSVGCWEFEIDGIHYDLIHNPVFDPQIIDELPKIRQWINALEAEIDKAIAEQLDGWCEWDGKKDLFSIDVSCLLEKDQVDVSYSGNEKWGDLGVNIVITDGKIVDVYSGD